MQLSKLEVKGFKSFGDKVSIHFDKGITGIVGPNGCGKSNVVDSIRWVLGEQKTKALRSEKMENIIFNGSKNRKALQMAEVSISFNNTKNLLPTEYTQVTITRRYYRTGESEYQLNGVTCRLKDINDLFLDTGVGPDSYAIIELKMVDDILNDKDHSRRELFEEAAGISKYKIRKKQTLKKLEDTAADLARVDDLLFEIEKNLKNLEKQAKQAEKYFQLKEEYKSDSIQIALQSIKKSKDSFDFINRKIQEEKDKRLALDTQIAQNEAFIEQQKKGYLDAEKLVASRQRAVNEHIAKIREYESNKKIQNERLRYLTSRQQQLLEQLENDQKNNSRIEFSLKSLSEEIAQLSQVKVQSEELVNQLESDLNTQKELLSINQEDLSIWQKTLADKQQKQHEISKNIEIAQAQLITLKQEQEKNQSDNSQQYAGMAEFEEKVFHLQTQLEAKEEELYRSREREQILQDNIEKATLELEEIKEKLSKQSRILDAKQNEFNLTKSLVDNLEGFPEAVRFLKKNVESIKNAPILSDIITCDTKYRVLIENYLEPFLNYYILDRQEDALYAINLLSNSAKGKAHFFVLSQFKNFIPHENIRTQGLICAFDIVEYDEKYRNLFAYLLQEVYILEGEEESIPEKKEGTFISNSGKIVKRKYSYSGGSVGLFEGKRIGRAKNMEKLEKEIASLTSDIINLRQEQNKKSNLVQELRLSSRKAALESLTSETIEIKSQLSTYKAKHEQLKSLLQSNEDRQTHLSEKIIALEEEVKNSLPDYQSTTEELAEANKHVKQLTEIITPLQNKVESLRNQFAQEHAKLVQTNSKLESLTKEVEYKQQTLDNAQKRHQALREELTKVEEESKQLLDHVSIDDDYLIALYEEKESLENGLREAEIEYYKLRGAIDELEKENKETFKKRENADMLIMELQNQLNTSVVEFTSVKERLLAEFNIDVDKELEKNPEIIEISEQELAELKKKNESTKSAIERIGPINPMAMDAYNEIKERHSFITSQKNDLLEARNTLSQTISEIDEVAKNAFIEAFNKIRENFIHVFRSLFSEEDSCDLKLVNPNEPTESDIDIIAKPKGKRPLTINQLSGGEKTLTAISLLFAIYLLKPAPFCIFDEVDAPLDDANIDKFNNIIRKFSSESQFIIVTHNKRTMASTDIIYGVTMEEQGVSRVVPVDLRELT